MNNFVIVGRYKTIKGDYFIITVNRPFKNEDGEYESYDLKIFSSENIINNMLEYVETGDVIGIRGRIEKDDKLFAEKISFLSSKK